MTVWTQPSLLDLLDVVEPPRQMRYTCEACGGTELTPMKGNSHGMPTMHEGRLHCREMSNALSFIGVYLHDYVGRSIERIHCCAFVHELPAHGRLDSNGQVVIVLPEDTDWSRMAAQRWEHIVHAYQEGLKAWKKHIDAYNLKIIKHSMTFGLNPAKTDELLRKSGRQFAPYRMTFESPHCQEIEVRKWWREHVGTLIHERVECTCGLNFHPDNWDCHIAGYPTPTI